MNAQEARVCGWITSNDEAINHFGKIYSAKIMFKIRKIRELAATVEGDIDAKLEAVRKEFPEEFK